MKDLASKLAFAQLFGPAALAADQAAVIIDLQGYNSAVLALSVGVGGVTFDGANYIEFTLEHSDDNAAWSNVAATDLNGKDAPSGIVAGQNGAAVLKALKTLAAAPAVYEVGYIGGKRFLRADIEFTGAHANPTPVSWTAVRSNAMVQPAA